MEDLGKYLLSRRESLGISYQRVWEDIRIREEHIKLLESNRLFEIGPYGVVKAIVFNYARCLEADINSVMAEFKVMMPEHTKKEFIPQRSIREKKILLSTNFLWTIGILIFVAILGGILLHSYRQGWLKTPDFFASTQDSTRVERKKADAIETKPDSLRMKMRILSETIPKSNTATDLTGKKAAPADTTDYIGNILNHSPLNVPIH
ncbi:MAG TPA: helix-turn-helix domain-containing protein [Candidatus Cloacimonadota bacterium]|nr:helix-turn-helix domain-containing protein [Candidatus Cloacimonadota bacterium]